MKQVLMAAVLVLAFAGSAYAQDQRAKFDEIRSQEEADPSAAFTAMVALAEEDFAPATDRVGYYFRHGIGTPIGLSEARAWYARAVSAGHSWSTASLARVEIELGNEEAALHLLRTAARTNRPGTRRLLATAHIDRTLGDPSDPELGRRMLEGMAGDGDTNAARDLIARFNWNRLDGQASHAAVELVVRTGLGGDVRFAEAALVYLSRSGDKSDRVIQTRALLADVPGMHDRILSPERIRLAADTRPDQFWQAVEEVLVNTESENYARTASTAFWINKNAWVRVLQKELSALGYYSGRINGLMTKRTIRAQNRFCKDSGLWTTCVTGPLRGSTVRTVAAEIARRKPDA
ncbi:hypothetical protein [uncultured Tateyamaria sp.]|uniref:hypothetical protein n=1 Tax=uncultured Tateyamaria sp. TaxID=455651 RepID=UPI002624F72F|nr:hypothetical protein [uncultured Tateyamaria sp.]